MSEWPYTPRPATEEGAAPAVESRRISVHDLPDEAIQPPEGTPFTVTLYFRNGLVRDFRVTKFEMDVDEDGIQVASWEQADPQPGDELLQYLEWNDIILATTRTVEVP